MNAQSRAIELMRQFYTEFPYPRQSCWLWPDPARSLVSHAGFHALCRDGAQEECEDIWSLGRLRPWAKCEAQAKLTRLRRGFSGRILLAGCGTDEPLLFRRLHPDNPIVAVDLSERALKLAGRRLGLHGLLRSASGSTTLVCGDLNVVGQQIAEGGFDFQQCFGVLHHQADPALLFETLASMLRPGGCLRIMVYSESGRRLERWIQRRYSALWRQENGLNAIVRAANRLRWWQLLTQFFLAGGIGRRFRYLGFGRSHIADALMHPSDPGFSLESLEGLAGEHGLRMVFCESKSSESGWLVGFGARAPEVWGHIVDAEKRQDLLRNVIVTFSRDSENILTDGAE